MECSVFVSRPFLKITSGLVFMVVRDMVGSGSRHNKFEFYEMYFWCLRLEVCEVYDIANRSWSRPYLLIWAGHIPQTRFLLREAARYMVALIALFLGMKWPFFSLAVITHKFRREGLLIASYGSEWMTRVLNNNSLTRCSCWPCAVWEIRRHMLTNKLGSRQACKMSIKNQWFKPFGQIARHSWRQSILTSLINFTDNITNVGNRIRKEARTFVQKYQAPQNM